MRVNRKIILIIPVLIIELLSFNLLNIGISKASIEDWPYISIDTVQADKIEGQAAAANDKIAITIDGEYHSTVTADSNAIWRYTPIGLECGVDYLVRAYNESKAAAYQGDFAVSSARFNAFTMDYNNISASSRISYVNGSGAGVFGSPATSKSGRYTYFNDNSTGNIGVVDMQTGSVTHAGSSGGSFSLIASPDGRFLYTNGGAIFDISGANESAPVQVFSFRYSSYFGLSISSDGSKLVVADTVNNVSIYDRNINTGDVTLNTVLSIPGANVIQGAFISPDSKTIVVPGYYENKIHIIDISGGLLAPVYNSINTIGANDFPVYAVFHPDNSTVYISNYGNSVESVSAIDLANNNIYYVNAPAGQGGSIAISTDGKYLIVPIDGSPEKIMYLDTSVNKLSPMLATTIDTALTPGASSEYVGYSAPSETATLNIPCTPQIGVSKRLDSVLKISDDKYDVTFNYFIKNYGSTTLTNLSIIEDLHSRFPSPTTTNVLNLETEAGLTKDPLYDGINKINMLSGDDSLDPGVGKNVTLKIRVENIGRTISGDLMTYSNQVKAVALDEGSLVTDDSVDDTNLSPDPNTDNLPYEQNITPVVFPLYRGAVVGVAEQVTDYQNIDFNTMSYTIEINIKNYGDLDLDSDVSLTNDLLSTFSGVLPSDINITSMPEIIDCTNSNIVLNSNFNGTTDLNIIDSSGVNNIGVGGECKIRLTFSVNTTNASNLTGPWNNSSTASGKDNLNNITTDISNDGTNPDTDDNTITDENNDNNPTVLSFIDNPPVVTPTDPGTSSGNNSTNNDAKLAQTGIDIIKYVILSLIILLSASIITKKTRSYKFINSKISL